MTSRTEKSFKFLARGSRGPFSGHVWSTEWLTTEGPLDFGRRGFHVCRVADLAYWLHEELWETEIAGAVLEGKDCLVAERARLVRRVTNWNSAALGRFADACILHASENAELPDYLEDARQANQYGYAAVAAFSAAMARGQSFREERAWQSTWLAKEFLGDV